MDDLIKIKGGSGNVPRLQTRELGYSYDENALYIGTDEGNVRLIGAGDITRLQTELNTLKARIDKLEADISVPSE